MSPSSFRPAPIRTDQSNAFANKTMRVRLPAIIDEVKTLNPDYPPDILRHLTWLRRDLSEGARIAESELLPAGDIGDWSRALKRQRDIVASEPTWQNAEWFFAETYAYRCLIEAVRWRESGRRLVYFHASTRLVGKPFAAKASKAVSRSPGSEPRMLSNASR